MIESSEDTQVIRKVLRRLIPFCIVCYLLNYLDRVNISIAKLKMGADAGGVTGFDEHVFSIGAAIFFVGYFLFEVPSNLIQERVGARRWIARIMVTWGIISMCFVFTRGPASFYTLRFLLGAAEAGFFPGMILYLSQWVPRAYRARASAAFLTSTAISGVIGNPLGGFILYFTEAHPLWLKSWQWLFVIEGVPSVALGLLTLFFLNDRPSDAKWLTAEERTGLMAMLAREQTEHPAGETRQLKHAFLAGHTWYLALLYGVMIFGFYAVNFFTPTILKQVLLAAGTVKKETPDHLVSLIVGLCSAIPFGVATVGMVLIGRSSDRHKERRKHLMFACVLIVIGLGGAGLVCGGHAWWSAAATIAGLSIGAVGAFGMFGPFWALPPALLTGTAVAASVAIINSIGNLFGGFVGPPALSYLGMERGFLVAAGLGAVGAIMAAFAPERASEVGAVAVRDPLVAAADAPP